MTHEKEIKKHLRYYEELLQSETQFFDEPIERQVMFFTLGKQFLENLMELLDDEPTEKNFLQSVYYKSFLETGAQIRIIKRC